MLSSEALIVWLVSLFAACSSSTLSANQVLGRTLVSHYDFANNKNILFTHLSNNGSHFLNGVCIGHDSEKHCKITLDPLDSYGMPLACYVTVKVSTKDTKIDENVVVALLRNDRALVLSKLGPKIKLTNVNLRNCSTSEAEIATDEEQHIFGVNVVPYESSYDIFFANSKLCQKRHCRITFDNGGKIMKQAAAWGDEFTDLGLMQAADHRSPVSGFIVKNMAFSFKPYASIINNEGKKLLTVRSEEGAGDVALSMTHNYIGTCSSYWIHEPSSVTSRRILQCEKFDFEGKFVKIELQVNTSSLVGERKKIRYMSRLNLPEGFLLFTVLCPETYYGTSSGEESYFVYHLDDNGKTLKTIEISDLKCQENTEFGLPIAFQNDAGLKCVSLQCNDWPLQKLSTAVRCFTGDE